MAKVMVVDDNEVNRDLVVTLLGYRGHRMVQANDGAEALATARIERPDLVITDLVMPVMDGYELIREIRADSILAATPVIFYTANYLQEEVAPIAVALGVRHIVSKPIDPHHLLRTVDEALTDRVSVPSTPPETFHREHLRALSAKLLDKVRALEHVEVALRESEARFRSLAESSPVGIFSMTEAGQVSYRNPRLREICGLAHVADTTVPWASLVHSDDRERWLDALDRVVERRVAYSDRIRLVRSDGEQRWVHIQLAPVIDHTGLASFVGTVEDITTLIEAERQREEMDSRLRISERLESLGQLAAGIAHDFNNLLAVIVNYAHFVSEGIAEVAGSHPDPRWTQMQQDTEAISGAADRAAELTHQLLAFGRRDVVRSERVDVNAVVRGALKLLGRTIGEQVQLEHNLDKLLRPVISDRGQLEQVLMNLVVNARDAVGEGGSVAVSTDNIDVDARTAAMHAGSKPGSYTRLSVTDDGAGMSPETIARAFEPFFTTKPTGQGTGLGLATVYGIVTRLGGTISIGSEPGRGTSVRVYLPAADAELSAANAPVSGSPEALQMGSIGLGRIVLVTEDDDQIRAIADRILTEKGYSVVAVDRGAAALALLNDETNSFDLLLTDVVMPQMSGRELAEHAAQVRPALPVLFMSGYAGGLVSPGTIPAPGIDLLEKPFTQSSLLTAVARALRPGYTSKPLLAR